MFFLSNFGKPGFKSSNTFADSLGDNPELGYGSRSTITNKRLSAACATYARNNTLIDIEMHQNKVRQILRGFEGDTTRAQQELCPDWSTEMIGCELLDKSHATRLDREYERNLMHDFSDGLYKDVVVDDDSDQESEEVDAESEQLIKTLRTRRQQAFALLMKYFPRLCSKTFYGHVQSKLQAQFPGGFKDGTKDHWLFVKNVVVEMCQVPDWVNEANKLVEEVGKLNTLTDVIDAIHNFQRWSNFDMTESQILSFMVHHVLGRKGEEECRTNSIKVRELLTLDQWSSALAALEPGAMIAINKALAINKHSLARQAGQRKRGKPGNQTSGGGSAKPSGATCRYFARGSCQRGDNCTYLHVKEDGGAPREKKIRKDTEGQTAPTRSLSSMAANGSSPSHRTPQRGKLVCFKCHTAGHKAPEGNVNDADA